MATVLVSYCIFISHMSLRSENGSCKVSSENHFFGLIEVIEKTGTTRVIVAIFITSI